MLVICAKSGQLGNRLLLFANFIAFAIENNFTVFNPAFDEYAEFFQSTSRDILCRYPVSKLPLPGNLALRRYYYKFTRDLVDSGKFNTIDIKRNQTFNWSNSHIKNELKPSGINFFQGWLFRDGWFVEDLAILHKHRETICSYFKPASKYQLNVNKKIAKIRHSTDLLVGVHIRQGDYQNHQDGKYFYQTEYYVKIMKSILDLFPNQTIKFLICSNQEQNDSDFQYLSYCYGNNHLIEDMYALAECDYIIGPPSSYSMWASFYGDRPLYMIRDVNKSVTIEDFVHSYQWQGVFHYNDDWSKSFWEWTH
ncbi:MAG TPA: alpha-1,2-fucosyltransferase [Trichormus sp. M33_DOE_039]|nr:alpha-1,2-fucosyltransferase [Trichormus sp. M33_DOE_039]